MNAPVSRRIGSVILFSAALFVWGCSAVSPAVQFYTLSAIQPGPADKMASDLKVVVGPVRLPGYLDRPQMVFRTGKNKIQMVEYHRWADSLKENITWGLAENIGILLKSDHVSMYPRETADHPDYQVFINIRQFDGWFGKRVRIGAYWTVRVSGHPSMTPSRQEKTIVEEPVDGKTHQDMVAAFSRAIETLSRDIAGAILAMDRQNRS